MAYAVFYKGGTLRIHDKIVVEMDAPGMLMVKYNDAGEILTLGVSDPTRFMKKLHLSVNQRIVGTAQENIQTEWDGKQALTRISVDLPQNEYAGNGKDSSQKKRPLSTSRSPPVSKTHSSQSFYRHNSE